MVGAEGDEDGDNGFRLTGAWWPPQAGDGVGEGGEDGRGLAGVEAGEGGQVDGGEGEEEARARGGAVGREEGGDGAGGGGPEGKL